MTRRRWLRRAAIGVGLLVEDGRQFARGLIAIAWLRPATACASELRPLSGAELDTLLAFGEVVVDGRLLPAAARATLTEAIADAISHAPDRASLYRGAALFLDHLAGRELGSLEFADRAELIARHRLDIRAVAHERVADDALFIRTSLGPELIVAYWRSAAGWAAVGYQTFPGRCGDLVRYTRPES